MTNQPKNIELPTPSNIAFALRDVRRMLAKWGLTECEVRLQVLSTTGFAGVNDWQIHVGLADYDTDHSGYWGETTIALDDSDYDIETAALELRDQALDMATQDGWL